MILDPARGESGSLGDPDASFSQTEEAWDIYRLLVENSYDLVSELDTEGDFVYINPSYQRSLGYNASELLHKNALDFVHPKDLEKARRELRQQDGTTVLRFRHQSGAWKWFDCSFRQFRTPLGSRTVLISRDISARKEAEIKFDVLASLGSKLSSTKTQIEAARVIAEAARTLCGWDAFSLDLYKRAEDRIYPILMIDQIGARTTEVAAEHESRPPSRFVRLVLENGPQLRLRKGNDFDPELKPFGDTGHASASLMFVPISEGGEILGVVTVQSYRINAYSRSDLKLLQVLAGHCAGTLGRIRVVDELRATQARFEAFMEHTPGAAWIKDEETRYIYANERIETLLRKPRAEILYQTDDDLFSPAEAERLRATEAEIRKKGQATRVQGSLLPGDSREWFICRFPFTSPSGAQLVGGLAFDVTDQVLLQRSLHQSEERFRTLFEAAPVGIGLVLHSDLLFTNFTFRQLFGLPAEAATANRPFLENIAPSSRTELEKYFATAGSAASLAATEILGRRLDGSEFPCLLQIAPVELQEGRAHIVFVVDISEKRALEAQLFQSQKMESIGRLAGGIAHDFANLLTVIHGHAGRLERGVSNPAPSIDGIVRACLKATELTRQLLAFSRKQTLKIVEVDLNAVVNEAARMIERVLGENITLRLHLSPALPTIHADQTLIEQMILNLGVTSRESMQLGGNLTISTSYEAPDAKAPHGWEKGTIRLIIRDTGRGFPPEDLPHLFEPFFKTSAGTDVALRLATAYGIVKQHNGNIEARSEAGMGTTYDVSFPASAWPTRPPEAPSLQPANRELILVVEDSADLRMMLHDLLVDFGYAVLHAGSYAEAQQIFSANRNRISLVIADVFLGDGSGRELVRQLRAAKPGLRAILTTGYDPHQFRGKMDLQPDEIFLPKPFPSDELLNSVEMLLAAK